jgi:ribonuclease P/MRP protein subunit RPP1
MRHYDMCVRCGSVSEVADVAKKLGWDGMCVLVSPEMFAQTKESAPVQKGIDISLGVEVEVRKPSDIQKTVEKFRRNAEILAFRSNTAEMNRAVLETAEADLLLGAWEGGVNHVLAAAAKDNEVAVCFEFQPLMFSHARHRTELFAKMLEAAKYLRKAGAPVAIGSGGQSPMDLRDWGMLTSFGRLLGLGDAMVQEGFSGRRVLENRRRLSGKWVMPGVEAE